MKSCAWKNRSRQLEWTVSTAVDTVDLAGEIVQFKFIVECGAADP